MPEGQLPLRRVLDLCEEVQADDGGTTSYRYDAAGNMINRTTPADGDQTLSWDDHGNLTSVTGGKAGDSSFEYHADGELLIGNDAGRSTLYLGDQQISLDTAGVETGVRYYTLPGGGRPTGPRPVAGCSRRSVPCQPVVGGDLQ